MNRIKTDEELAAMFDIQGSIQPFRYCPQCKDTRHLSKFDGHKTMEPNRWCKDCVKKNRLSKKVPAQDAFAESVGTESFKLTRIL